MATAGRVEVQVAGSPSRTVPRAATAQRQKELGGRAACLRWRAATPQHRGLSPGVGPG